MNKYEMFKALHSLAKEAGEDKILLPVPLPSTEAEEEEQERSTSRVEWRTYSLKRLLDFIADMVE
mgnify:FL=1